MLKTGPGMIFGMRLMQQKLKMNFPGHRRLLSNKDSEKLSGGIWITLTGVRKFLAGSRNCRESD